MRGTQFQPGQTFIWQGQQYEVRQLLVNSCLTIAKLQTGAVQTVALTELVTAILADELQLMDANPSDPSQASPKLTLADYPEQLQAIAEYRWQIIEPLIQVVSQDRHAAIQRRVEECQAQYQTGNRSLQSAVSESSIYRWLKTYLNSNGDKRSLIPDTTKRGGHSQSRLEVEAEAILTATIADHSLVQEQRTTDYIHREVALRINQENERRKADQQLALPSRTTVWRRLVKYEAQKRKPTKRDRQVGKREKRQFEQTPYPTLPLERVEIDHTRADIIVVDETDLLPLGRLTLTYCLDTATRYPLGYYLGFEPPSYLAVKACLHHAICPKVNIPSRYETSHDWLAHGLPNTLVIDNGKEFIGQDLDDACQLLGMILQRTPVKTPHFKAAVERMFGTLNTGLLHTLPGTTFANPPQRGDYDSVKHACLTLGDLDQVLHLFLLDIYAENFHQGLQDIPARRWEKATQAGFFPRVPTSVTDLHIFLGRVAYRTVQPYGIELHTLRYNSAELIPLRTRLKKQPDKRAKVKYDPADLSRIYVLDADQETYLEVPALAQAYTQGLSLWKHRVIRNFVLSQQKTVDIAALGQAQRQIQEIVEQSLERKQLATRSKMARWQYPPKQAEPDTQPVIIDQPPDPQPALDFEVTLDPEKLKAEGWSLGYEEPVPLTSPRSVQ